MFFQFQILQSIAQQLETCVRMVIDVDVHLHGLNCCQRGTRPQELTEDMEYDIEAERNSRPTSVSR